MSSQRNDTEGLIKKYHADIASLEEKEEYLTRRIQVMENLIPTVTVWYMWKVAQARKPETFSQSRSEEEAKKQLLHLENILEELQEADYILKEEETVLRTRIEELELSLKEGANEPFLRGKEKKVNEVVKEGKRIKVFEENKIQIQDLLEDPNTDWQSKCEEMCKKVNELIETLEETNYALQNKDYCIKQLQEDLREKDIVVGTKIKDLEKQNEILLSEVIDREKERDTEEAYMNKKVYSAVQEAIEEVETLRISLTKKSSLRKEEKYQKGGMNKFSPQHYSIAEKEDEEETKTDLLDRKSPDSNSFPEFYQKPLVLAPDEVLPGSHASASKLSATIHPLPQIFEPLETVKESSRQSDSVVKLRTTATGTIISVPPDIPILLPVKTESLSSMDNPSFSKAELVLQKVQTSQLDQPVPSGTVGRQYDCVPPKLTVDPVEYKTYPTENDISVMETKGSPSRVSKQYIQTSQLEQSGLTDTAARLNDPPISTPTADVVEHKMYPTENGISEIKTQVPTPRVSKENGQTSQLEQPVLLGTATNQYESSPLISSVDLVEHKMSPKEKKISEIKTKVPSLRVSKENVQTSQLEQPVLSGTAANQYDSDNPTSSEDLVEHEIYPTDDKISEIKTKVPAPRNSKEPPVSAIPETQAGVSPIAHSSSTKATDGLKLSAEADVRVELLTIEQTCVGPLTPKMASGIPENPEKQPEEEIKVPQSGTDWNKKKYLVEDAVLSQISKTASKVSGVLTDEPLPEFNTVEVKSAEARPYPEQPKLKSSVRAAEPIPSTSKAAADMSEAHAIISEPYEVPDNGMAQMTIISLLSLSF